MSTPDPGSLDARLAALPRELPPAKDLWPGIAAALAPERRPARYWPYALAAGVALLVVGGLIGARLAREGGLAAPGAQGEDGLLAAHFEAPHDENFQTTRVALVQTYRERLALLSPVTRARVEADLAVIHSAQDDIRRALTRDPGSRVLSQLLESTTEQEFALYATVGRNTEPFAPRTRT